MFAFSSALASTFISLLLATQLLTPSYVAAAPDPQASTSPALPAPTAYLDRRQYPPAPNMGFYICNGAYWSGVCKHVASIEDVCVNLNTLDWTGNITSIAPDPGVSCYVHSGYGCDAEDPNSDMWGYRYPGTGDITRSSWSENILSWKCRSILECTGGISRYSLPLPGQK
ncbi:hypothetical protein W97_02126 [Coniosporium apollinis CBS 100218]|uniref:Uncharacterized protein n=1 Tax=Coniosporium apollinis (strain CBS 100218) TaxID=1168221 RepID=R7YML4_CONA1|nr:uncharacterized protein W97_02126 [Coniosporium apollinis CBS 100218]EON62901.1 hypothetical protein W97_02126 [Coniosporium apollinis CBS 100218]